MKDGGPAFPRGGMGGMTLRQWYKGMALAGMMANVDYTTVSWDIMAHSCGSVADALLREDEGAGK